MSKTAGYILDDVKSYDFPMTNVVEELENTKASAQSWSVQSCLVAILNTYDLGAQTDCMTAFVKTRTGLIGAIKELKTTAGL